MTKIERVLAMIRGEAVDKLPKGEFFIEDALVSRLLQLSPSPSPQSVDLEARMKACELLGLDTLVFMADQKKPGRPWAELQQWQEESDFFLFSLLDGPFQGVGYTYPDFTDFLMDTMRDKEKIEELVKESVQRSLNLGRAAITSGAHGLFIADDIAYNHGLYISPRIMREMFFPYLKELLQGLSRTAREVTGREIPIFFHSDGDIRLILQDLKEIGFNGIHSLESVMDLAQVREAVGGDMCLMGGYELGWFETGGTSKVDELFKTAMPGRYIFGSSAGILDAGLSPQAVLEVYRYIDKIKCCEGMS
ncbi:uroporphyrinogen decarboxylase family protein [Desulfitobacterium sp. PCE1]|uniref:uroporphyrinogen decarboxylase family protein n=1 Tax=Desulfitobacterium sp. PCE1 TaxID=146907 RepID=UPI000376AFD9|nr:uroporphyrinogen decarboxylase family protein [Desulfitobacterium sp. PCE1]